MAPGVGGSAVTSRFGNLPLMTSQGAGIGFYITVLSSSLCYQTERDSTKLTAKQLRTRAQSTQPHARMRKSDVFVLLWFDLFCVIQFEYIIFPPIHVTCYQSSYQAVAGGALYPFCAHSLTEPAGGAVSPPAGAGGGRSAHTSALLLAFSLQLLNELFKEYTKA